LAAVAESASVLEQNPSKQGLKQAKKKPRLWAGLVGFRAKSIKTRIETLHPWFSFPFRPCFRAKSIKTRIETTSSYLFPNFETKF